MKHIRYFVRVITRWAWQPIITEFVRRERSVAAMANHYEDALRNIGYRNPQVPKAVARKALE